MAQRRGDSSEEEVSPAAYGTTSKGNSLQRLNGTATHRVRQHEAEMTVGDASPGSRPLQLRVEADTGHQDGGGAPAKGGRPYGGRRGGPVRSSQGGGPWHSRGRSVLRRLRRLNGVHLMAAWNKPNRGAAHRQPTVGAAHSSKMRPQPRRVKRPVKQRRQVRGEEVVMAQRAAQRKNNARPWRLGSGQRGGRLGSEVG
ncbi:uncharacterized protein LOC125518913 [Triticum urartu]|uniref:uncharacterized protein LOC125518913 n=1 Tax=Triticum urartu TaxID=4572 RepID=UPI00204347C0|nr:uncharacterized protein LOC125518913 [Triticum urartu]